MRTSLGQSMDLLSAPNPGEKPNIDEFTMDKYYAIVKYKTAYYSFFLPVALAMYMVTMLIAILFLLLSLLSLKNILLCRESFRLESVIRIQWKKLKISYFQWVNSFKYKMIILTVLVIPR